MARDSEGNVILGPGTKKSCDQAIEVATSDNDENIVVTAAGCASTSWGKAWMGDLMHKYIKDRTNGSVRSVRHCSGMFNTIGEVSFAAYMVDHKSHRFASPGFTIHNYIELVFTVKNWHAPRVYYIARRILNARDCKSVTISMRTHHLPVGLKTLAKEYFGAWPKTIYRMRDPNEFQREHRLP